MIQKSDISEEDIVSPLIPIIFFTVIVCSWTRSNFLGVFEARLFALKDAIVLQHFKPTFFSMLILDFLDDIIVLVIVIRPLCLLKAGLSNSKTRLLDDKIRILLLFFYYSGCNIVVNYIVASNCRALSSFVNELSLYLRFKSWWDLFLTINKLWIIRAWGWSFVLLLIFASYLSRAELPSVAALYFVYQLVLHCISRLIGPWSWYLCTPSNEGGTSGFLLYLCSLFGFGLFSKLEADVIGSRTNYPRGSYCCSALKPFASSKRGCSFSSLRPRNFRNLEIRSWPRSCIIDVLILAIFIIRGNMSGSWSFFGHDSAFDRIIVPLFFYFFVCIDDCTFPLVHCPHRLACKIRWRFVVIERTNGGDFVTARPDILISFDFLYLPAFGLRPRYSSTFDDAYIRIILPWTNFIFLFAFEVLDGGLVQLQLIVLVFVVAKGVNIRRNGGNRLVLVQVYQMLQNLRLGGSVGAHSLRSNLQASLVAE